jgi:hypothetical protein
MSVAELIDEHAGPGVGVLWTEMTAALDLHSDRLCPPRPL